MKTIGQLLRETRLSQNLSLSEIARNIKIKKDYLQALENNDFNRLPPSTFIKGFLRKYAQYLGLNPDNAVAIFRRDFIQDEQGNIVPRPLTRSFSSSRRLFSFSTLAWLTAVLTFIGFLAFQLYQYYSLPKLKLFQPLEDEIYTSQITVKGQTNPGNTVTINGQEVTVSQDGQFFLELNLPAGHQSLTIKATNPQGKSRLLHRTFQIVE